MHEQQKFECQFDWDSRISQSYCLIDIWLKLHSISINVHVVYLNDLFSVSDTFQYIPISCRDAHAAHTSYGEKQVREIPLTSRRVRCCLHIFSFQQFPARRERESTIWVYESIFKIE